MRRLLADGIVRNRAKIEAMIANARAAADLGSSEDLLSCAVVVRATARPGLVDGSTPRSARNRRLCRELKRRGGLLRRAHHRLCVDGVTDGSTTILRWVPTERSFDQLAARWRQEVTPGLVHLMNPE